MKKCNKCGCEFNDYEEICPGCGEKQGNISDKYYIVIAVLSVFLPMLGIIFYMLLRNNNKRFAEISIIGAIGSLLFQLFLILLYYL